MTEKNIEQETTYSPREEHGKDGDRSHEPKGKRGFHRKKVCRFCVDNTIALDYKDSKLMQSFLTERGKIVPRRISGSCASHQRQLTTEIKRARHLALVGFIGQIA